MRRLLPILLLAAPVLTTGCPSAGRHAQPKVKAAPPATVEKPKAAVRKIWPFEGEYWRDELGQFNSIPMLWRAINKHQDGLGQALNPGYRSYRISPLVRRRPPRRRVGGGSTVPPRPRPPDIDRPPVTQRGGPPLCRRACNHVRAICYAARRICRIASHLRDYRALQTCKRATARCADAKRAARRKCPSCG